MSRLLHLAAALVGCAVLAGCTAPPAVAPAAFRTPVTRSVVPLAATPQAPEVVPAPAAAPAVPPLRAVDRLEQSPPAGLDVPAIGVSTDRIAALAPDAGGVLAVPADAATTGWFTRGPTPGADGPAVIAGHVGMGGSAGPFARLAEVAVGDEITVRRTDGTDAVFTVYRVERVTREAFSSDEVYGDTGGPELRLITFGGVFDRGDGPYPDNVVVWARLAGVR
ncbi:sortase domain-containing protein [Pseudonocardia abyssalis]|uniref:Class F sortase n=1 Tax=Pseudonocardia abyssalis TaxID=2792008 RepID=A0ABS6UXA4_9PSEU|nr:sortase [Pseudonocardia abyssalis]MBW0116719.1 class F sortase [Pseudonocardia abyssalis]MBW0136802.1 class F sortase [Pseudonocardia abyssalis]